jgi:UDP-glucoronosyl and UDP-glucosyl transferase
MDSNVVQFVVWKHLGADVPHVNEITKNVSFILQNTHFSVSYPRAHMPNVAEIGCIHCKAANPLPTVRIQMF